MVGRSEAALADTMETTRETLAVRAAGGARDRDDESQAAKEPDPMRSEKGTLREWPIADAIGGCETRIVSPHQCSAQ